MSDIKWLCFSGVILKSDNEPAILKLLTESLRELRIEGVPELLEDID